MAHFTSQIAAGTGATARGFSAEAVQRLQRRNWPGNVRELRNAVERLLILSPGREVAAADVDRILPAEGDDLYTGAEPDGGHTFESFKQDAERGFLAQQLREHDWNVSETARALKMPRSNLYKKIERYGLKRETP